MHTEKQKLSWCFLSDCIEALQDHRLGFDIQSLIYSLVSIRWLCLSNNLRGKRPLSVVKCEAGMRRSTGAKLARRPRESSIKRDGLFPENVRKKTEGERGTLAVIENGKSTLTRIHFLTETKLYRGEWCSGLKVFAQSWWPCLDLKLPCVRSANQWAP